MNKSMSDLLLARLLIFLLAMGFSISAFSSSTLYKIDSSNPALSGSFNFDDINTSPFSNFEISVLFSGQTWSLAQEEWLKSGQVGPEPELSNYTATLSFDLTDWANYKTIISSCYGEWCIKTPADAFSLLTTNPVNWNATLALSYKYQFFLNFGNYSQPYSLALDPSDAWYNFNIVYDQAPGDGLFQNTIEGTFNVSPVPEPSIYTMLLAGLGLISLNLRRRSES